VLAGIKIILTLLLTVEPAQANGIQVIPLPPENEFFEMIAGYRAGIRDETSGSSGLAAAVASFLLSSRSARELALAAYSAGGDFEFFSELDRTGFHVKAPLWAKAMVEAAAARFFAEVPEKDAALTDFALADARMRPEASDADFRAKVEDEIRIALLGSHPYHHRPSGWKTDLAELSRTDLQQFFNQNYGTDRAFVMMSGPPSALLGEIPARMSRQPKMARNEVFKADRILKFPAELNPGAVILASPIPAVYYKRWYAVLLVDKLIERLVPGKPAGTLVPALDPYYYRIEIPVPAGQFVDAVQENFLHEIERLQYTRAPDRDLQEARQSAIEYLESPAVQRWFLSFGMAERRQEGIEWIRSFSADDLRATVRDLLISNRVVATWPPKPTEAVVAVEKLSDSTPSTAPALRPTLEAGTLRQASFPAHTDPLISQARPERLASGVSIVGSSMHAIFVAPNSLDLFKHEPSFEIMQSYGAYKASRILVMAPAQDLERVKQQWNLFLGNPRDATPTPLSGNVKAADLAALLILKTLIDRKLIEGALWKDVQLDISAAGGSQLTIQANDADRARVLGWIKDAASNPPADSELAWAREVAVHRLNRMLPDIQSLIWQQDAAGVIPDLPTVSATHVQEVAQALIQ
jgi:hypothetical protein